MEKSISVKHFKKLKEDDVAVLDIVINQYSIMQLKNMAERISAMKLLHQILKH